MPLLYYSVVHFEAAGGIMITGSHNPPEYNGIKTVCGSGTLHGEQIQQVLKLIQGSDFESGAGTVKEIDAATPYVEEIASQFQFSRRVKVVFDAGNGTAGPVFHRILQKLNVEPVELFFEMDGRFPNHHPDPTVPENLRDLEKAVRKEKAELGIAFDGDADRIGAVDENGEVDLGRHAAADLRPRDSDAQAGATFIGEVKCSQVLYDKLEKAGGNPIM